MVEDIFVQNTLFFQEKKWKMLDSQIRGTYFMFFNQIFLNLTYLFVAKHDEGQPKEKCILFNP